MGVVVFLGAPGSGKGTQARLVADRCRMPQITTGELLRRHVRDRTEIGLIAKGCMDRGDLVSDEVVIRMIGQRMVEADCGRGAILDGFPRTLKQAEALGGLLSDMHVGWVKVIKIEVSEEELTRRLAGRRTCRQCDAQYHVDFDPPRRQGFCNRCHGELYQREDDQEETIRARLAVYQRETLPLDGYYARLQLLKQVDGHGQVEEVFRRVWTIVEDQDQ